MRTNRFIISLIVLIATMMLVVVSCKEEDDILPTTISLDEAVISLVLGTSQTIIPTIEPPISASEIIWSSSNTDVATVNGEGLVQSVGLGKAVINAKIGNSTSFCDVIVTDLHVPVRGISLNKINHVMRVGDIEKLVAEIEPYEATNRRKRWSSSNENAVSVHEINGTMTALAFGESVITVKTLDGDYTATCRVEVLPVIELFTPSEQSIILHPADGEKKVTFTWNNIEGISQYILKISTTDRFREEDIVYSSMATENNLEVTEYVLNEAIKGIEGNLISLYWTIESGTSGVKILPATGRVNLIPDRREFLRLSESSVSGMQLQKMTGEYQYLITTTGHAIVNTVNLTRDVPADSTVVSFIYKSNQELTSVFLRFMSSIGSVLGTSQKYIPKSAEWKELRILHTELPDGWGNAADFLQFDFGDTPGYQIELNAIRISGMTLAEEKEVYVPEMLKINDYNNQLAMLSLEDNYFKFLILSGDPNAQTVALTRKLPAGAVLFSFEYKSDMTLANNLQVFLGPALSEGRSIRAGTVPVNSTGEWKEHVVDMTTLRNTYPSWGNPGDNLRIDFGETPSVGMTMEIRNIHFKFKD